MPLGLRLIADRFDFSATAGALFVAFTSINYSLPFFYFVLLLFLNPPLPVATVLTPSKNLSGMRAASSLLERCFLNGILLFFRDTFSLNSSSDLPEPYLSLLLLIIFNIQLITTLS